MDQKWDYFVRNTGNLNSDGHEAQVRLRGARAAAKAGRSQEALEGYIWYHQNEVNLPGMRGARISFVLADWIDLGKAYPPARIALEAIRDTKPKSLFNGFPDVPFFHDVVFINEYLGCERATYELFVSLNSKYPLFSRKYSRLALAAIVNCGDFELARQHMLPPAEELQRLRDMFQRSPESMDVQSKIRMYAEGVNLLLKTLRGVGDAEKADRVLAAALESFESPDVRQAVRAALSKSD